MHAVVMESLEEYLSGSLEPVELREIEEHLSACQVCRDEVHGMQDVSLLFGSLQSDEALEPSTGFFTRIMAQVEEETPAPSFAGIFALDFAFGRRLVLASLLTLVVAGSFLVSREMENYTGMSPDAVMAQQNSPGFDSASGPDKMLVTLTTYEH